MYIDLSLAPRSYQNLQTDQYQYLGNCPPTPPLTQH